MANRRMFSKAVVGSARFMKMPIDSQNLYFHLGMYADDDGIVEAWSVLRNIGSAEDNLKVLATKGFIKVLNEDLVSYILDWNEHNAMRSDRITPSAYRELLVQVFPEVELIEPKQRADRMGRPRDNHGTAQDRIGEGREGEVNTSVAIAPQEYVISSNEEKPTKSSTAKYPHSKEVFGLWELVPQNWTVNKTQLGAAERLYEEHGIEEVKNALSWFKAYKDDLFCPQVPTPYDLDSKWLKLDAYINRT